MTSDRGGGFGSWRRPPLREIFYAEDRPIPAPGTRRFQPLSARSRIPCSLRAALFAAFAGRGFPSNFLRALVASVFGGGHRHDAQSTRATEHALRQGPSFTERRGVLQLGAASINSRRHAPDISLPRASPHASLHTPFIFPSRRAGRLRLSIAAGLPSGPRQRAAPSPVATDLTSIHPSVRRIRCATRSSRNAPCCSSSACC